MKNEKAVIENNIRSMWLLVKGYDDAYKAFLDDPSGDNIRLMDETREKMVRGSLIIFEVCFPNESESKMKRALEIGLKVLEYEEKQEKINSI